ncbi:acyl-CoA synthetase [Roseomonas arctica]|uniref:Acyl-CoA synthetase n=2 Tax=Plastoroseomonas arctica TaxID=1509237 RepID=A0AAF1KUY6_9PROT|nr:acyl-CoA synthetase [Plastoroseomonas arctica]
MIPLTQRAGGEILARRGAEPVTVATFLAEAMALAARLPARGPVINLCAERYLALVGFAAALIAGHTTLLSADRSARRVQELVASHGATAIIGDNPDATWPLPCVVPDGARADAGPVPAIAGDHLAAIAFTSGSTGLPVAHAKPWGSLVRHAEAAAHRFGLRHADGPSATILATVPAQHMYGFETTIMLPLHSAAAVYCGANFYPTDIAEALALVPGRRMLVTTPLQIRGQLEAGVALPTLEAVISATAPLASDLAAQAERAWDTRVLEIYGATEAGSLASRRTLDGEAWLPYDGIAVAIEDGAAIVDVPGLPHRVPLADALEALPEGRFRLVGRRSDVVKLAGKRASLAGLNRILCEIEGVRDGVFMAPDDIEADPGARLSAFVVAPGHSPEQIIAALRQRVESAFLPRPMLMVPALPRDALGKLSRRALAALREGSA